MLHKSDFIIQGFYKCISKNANVCYNLKFEIFFDRESSQSTLFYHETHIIVVYAGRRTWINPSVGKVQPVTF